MRKHLIVMAGAAAVCGSLLAAPAASALPPGCDHPTPQIAQLCAQARGNIAADQAPPTTGAATPPQVASNEQHFPNYSGPTQTPVAITPGVPPQPEQRNDVPYDKPSGVPLNPANQIPPDQNEQHFPAG
jgi:hypothetical protein